MKHGFTKHGPRVWFVCQSPLLLVSTLTLMTIMLVSCSGGGGQTGSGGSSGSGSPPGSAVPVSTAAGKISPGINITVPAARASPAPNAEFLGVGSGGTITAFATGDTIHQGASELVILFGPGLSGNMEVKISGPGDIVVSNIQSTKASDGTPGIQFTATVPLGAALGGRTVLLINSAGDITAFTGGLEVVP
ncbi:MAG: hypothetical protein ACE14M_08520 [Terriglobales bacterium]